MPSSASETLPYIIEFLREEVPNPKTILDVGMGFGALGFLVREYFEAKEHLRFTKADWQIELVGIEVYKKYISVLQRHLYNRVIIGDVFEVIDTLGMFDAVMMGDIIEHFTKRDGHRLLRQLFTHTKNILISTPYGYKRQGAIGKNRHETHKSGWMMNDFGGYRVIKKKVIPRIRRNESVFVALLQQQ